MSVVGALHRLVALIDELPQRFGYDPRLSNGPLTAHFWFRQAFHLTAGVLVGLSLWPCSRRTVRIVGGLLALALVAKELSELSRGQTVEKTVIDLAMWLLGFALGSWPQRRRTRALPPLASSVNS